MLASDATSTSTKTYTATQDCYVIISGSPGYVTIDNVQFSPVKSTDKYSYYILPLKKGQLYKGEESNTAYAKYEVYGIKQY